MYLLTVLSVFTLAVLSGCTLLPNTVPATSLEREQIRLVFIKNQKAFMDCYATALKRKSQLEGKILFDFDVNPDGRVSRARVNEEKSTLKDTEMNQCILASLRTWDFPKSESQVTAVEYPLAFKKD
jgi:hypothetical protein